MTDLPRIYLSPPHMSGLEKQYVEEAFTSNWIAPLGPNVDAFERELAAYLGIEEALVLNSGTAALHLALRLVGVEPGDTVFCSTLTFVPSANACLYLGAELVFIDSEPASWNMSPGALERALGDARKAGKLPKAVIVVNLYGQSADIDPLRQNCDAYGIPLIEDAAESLGALYKGKPSGTLGRFGIFSFNGNKIITTSGGGALVSADSKALQQARFLATQARDPARHYQHSQIGYNYRLSNVLAGIGRGQLQVLAERVEARRTIFQRYREALSPLGGFNFMPEAAFGRATRWLTVLTVDPRFGISAEEIMMALEEANIDTRPVWKPMHQQPLFKGCPYYPHTPGESLSDKLFREGVCLPSGSGLTEQEQERVLNCITALMKTR